MLFRSGLVVAGVVLSGDSNPENEAAISQHGHVEVASIYPADGKYIACPRNERWLEYLR